MRTVLQRTLPQGPSEYSRLPESAQSPGKLETQPLLPCCCPCPTRATTAVQLLVWGAPSEAEQLPNSPPVLGCMGLLIRGLMGAKPPMVRLVTSRGCGRGMLTEGGLARTWPAPYHKSPHGHAPPLRPRKGSPLTFEPPARTKWRVLHTNMPPFSTSFLQCRKAEPR